MLLVGQFSVNQNHPELRHCLAVVWVAMLGHPLLETAYIYPERSDVAGYNLDSTPQLEGYNMADPKLLDRAYHAVMTSFIEKGQAP